MAAQPPRRHSGKAAVMNSSPKERACDTSSVGRAASRLAAADLTGCQGGRCVWAHDFAPAFNTAGSDVDRRIVVGVPNEVTKTTFKCRLREAVSFVDMPTPAAHLRGVGRIDLDERHSGLVGLVGQKRPELGERPRMQRGPLGLAKPYPPTDSRQLFDGDTASGALRLVHRHTERTKRPAVSVFAIGVGVCVRENQLPKSRQRRSIW
jgi:hypothetical protein